MLVNNINVINYEKKFIESIIHEKINNRLYQALNIKIIDKNINYDKLLELVNKNIIKN